MRIARSVGVGIALVLGTFASLAEASTAVALSNKALTDTADVIATGRCVDVRSAWQGRTLVTIATIAVTETLKGEPAETLTVTLPGGIDANRKFPVSMVYAGAPQISVQEDVFLFLTRDDAPANGLIVAGFAQGKFSVVNDAQGAKVVSRNLSKLTLQSPAGTTRGTATQVSLTAFKNEILGYLQQPPEPRN
jgi:hypothetical protein